MRVAVASILVLLFSAHADAFAPGADLPKVNGKPVLARVNGEPLFLEEFERALAEIHSGAADNASRATQKPSVLLERLITSRLILQEARNIGLDALPEVRAEQKSSEEEMLRGMLYGFHVRNIRTPDKKEVEEIYRNTVKEVKLESVLFDKGEDAERVAAAVRAGAGFEGAARDAIAAGQAKGSAEGRYMKFDSLSADAARAISSMKKGEVSPVLRAGKQFYLMKLEDIRFPKDPAARRQAEMDALRAKQSRALKAYTETLRKKYVKVDGKLLESLDFDSEEPGIEKLRADGRTLATVKSDKPVTVADLTAAIEKRFFHGAERASAKKKIGRMKDQVFEGILNQRVSLLEAKERKLDRTEHFRKAAQENRDSLLFGTFVRKVIAPDVKAGEEELKDYYREHASEYMSPEMVRIEGLAFAEKGMAEDAIARLRSGADFLWIRENAEGQVVPDKGKNLPEFKGRVLTVAGLPEGVGKALSGAAAGDYRLYADPGKVYYVLHLLERIPSRQVPLETVKEQVEKEMVSEKVQRVLKDWEEKLRKASEVKIYATGKKLDRIVRPGAR